MNRHLSILGFATVLLLSVMAGCSERKSPLVVSEETMIDVLHDYHLADGIIRSGDYDSIQANRLIATVFAHNHITQQQFDSSMVYYIRHAQVMDEIYRKVNDRLSNTAKLNGINEDIASGVISSSGDTADVWTSRRMMMMRTVPPYNILRYTATVDSSFHKGDRFIWSFKATFLYQDGSRNGYAIMSLKLKNDSVITRTTTMMSSSTFRMEVSDDRNIGIKELKCYILDREPQSKHDRNSSTLRVMTVSDVKLIRMRDQNKDDEENNNNNQTDKQNEEDFTDSRPVPAVREH